MAEFEAMRELPLAGSAPAERADARRNRERILAAARELLGRRDLRELTMDELATQAGVAKGTIFHRFGNRAGLAVALVDDAERELQDLLLSGPPPLGPGAPARDRLAAFLDALLQHTVDNVRLLIISDYDEPGGRYRTGAYAAWRLHSARLLEELGYRRARAEGLAHALLAPLAADLIDHRLRNEGADLTEIKRECRALVEALADHARA
ncbi:MAG TPA: helix-turn-helix domain-containing protein [Solirubrobacterales bacterium]|nr:helix-turn-helix domain-containing protein [Solirubrobacterales bacterium]